MADGLLLDVTVLSPLHIGSGDAPLRPDAQYIAARGALWVVDLDRALAGLSIEQLERGHLPPLKNLVKASAYADVSRYRIDLPGGREQPEQVVPCIADVAGRPYVPGSSIKGALRTAVAWDLLSRGAARETLERVVREVVDQGGRGRVATARLERELFGRDPNHDALRALRVGDLAPRDDVAARRDLADVRLYGLRGTTLEPKGDAFRWDVEALAPEARLQGGVWLDRWLLEHDGFRDLPAVTALNDLPGVTRRFAAALAEAERAFYAEHGLPAMAAFYQDLAARVDDLGPDEGLFQLGWGTGWTAKTIGLLLARRPDFAQLRSRLGLGRGLSGAFPRTRRLVVQGDRPQAPLGWVRFRLAGAANGFRRVEAGTGGAG